MDNYSESPVMMCHYLCRACGMSATIVATNAGVRAWDDHMNGHLPGATFDAWAWEVLPLPLEVVGESRS